MNVLPFFGSGEFPIALQFIPALIVGFGFGFVLERSGFGRASVLVAQFYGHNMRVFKVMFTAIVTAAVGVALLGGVGILDLTAIYVPETFLWAHLIGGLLLGAGFVVSGYCPGTSIVAVASSKWDGAATIIGVVVGSVVFGALYPLVKPLYLAGSKGVMTFETLLGLPFSVLVVGVALMAVGFFFLAEKAEGFFAERNGFATPLSLTPNAKSGLATLVATAGVAAVLLLVPPLNTKTVPAGTPRPLASIDATTLATNLIDDPTGFYLVDLQTEKQCSKARRRIPRSLCYKQLVADLDALPAHKPLVIYNRSAAPLLPDGLFRYRGPILVLSGGFDSWKSTILQKPTLNGNREAFVKLATLHGYFTGQKNQPPVAPRVRRVLRRKGKKSGGCL